MAKSYLIFLATLVIYSIDAFAQNSEGGVLFAEDNVNPDMKQSHVRVLKFVYLGQFEGS